MKSLLMTALVLASASAHAQDARRATADVAPWLALDCGVGYGQATLASTQFSVLDTWNGQNTTYHVTGATLGLIHPGGLLFYATAHLFPFSFRGIGFVAKFEGLGLNADGHASATPFGNVDGSNGGPSMMSLIVGPEAQLRFDPIVVRAGALAGMRQASFGDFTAYEWRIAMHAQADYYLSGNRRGDSGISFGVFGGADVYPALGWSTGVSVSFAIF